jgi:hypothetical protein
MILVSLLIWCRGAEIELSCFLLALIISPLITVGFGILPPNTFTLNNDR